MTSRMQDYNSGLKPVLKYTYSFTQTSLGTIVKVTDGCTKEEIDLTEYLEW